MRDSLSSPEILTPQPNRFDRLLELLGVCFQAGDVGSPAAGTAATRPRLGEAAGNSTRDSIGPRRQAVDTPLNDAGGRTAVAAHAPRRDKQQPKGEQREPGEGVAPCRPRHGDFLPGSPRRGAFAPELRYV